MNAFVDTFWETIRENLTPVILQNDLEKGC